MILEHAFEQKDKNMATSGFWGIAKNGVEKRIKMITFNTKLVKILSGILICVYVQQSFSESSENQAQNSLSATHQALFDTLGVQANAIHAPWRDKFNNANKGNPTSNATAYQDSCPFCMQINESDDAKNFILARYKYHIIALNFFPYSNKGHILIIPYTHVKELCDLSHEARQELIELESASVALLKETYKAPAANTGRNLGSAAGASIPHHLHTQVLPRWHDDRSFIQLLGKTEVASVNLPEQYKTLAPKFQALQKLLKK